MEYSGPRTGSPMEEGLGHMSGAVKGERERACVCGCVCIQK